jgi:hypothetical protein
MCSTSQLDDPIVSKHVALEIIHVLVVLDGYLFVPNDAVHQNSVLNFLKSMFIKVLLFLWTGIAQSL